MKLYKLTKQDGTTHNGYNYAIIDHTHNKPIIDNPQLCSNQVFHGYKNKNLAFLLNPVHANISNPRLFQISGDIACEDFGKVGSLSQKVIRELKIPKWLGSEKDKLVRIAFAILCAEEVLVHFEDKYPSDGRPRKAIEATKKYLTNPTAEAAAAWAAAAAAWAAEAAEAAEAAAAAAAAAWAARAAEAAARAAEAAAAAAAAAAWAAAAAAWAAEAAAEAAEAAAEAAEAAAAAAAAAAWAAAAAEAAGNKIDFGVLADKAVEMIMGGGQ